jgi:hypothetical protein
MQMQQSLSLYAIENFSFSNVSSSSAQCEYQELCNQIQPYYHPYQVYSKSVKRGITNDDLVLNSSKRFKEYNTFFNFEELSKELDDMEFGSSDCFDSQSSGGMKVAGDSFAHSAKTPGVNDCLCDKSYENDLMDNNMPNACSTMLNSTDLEILNISSCSLSSPRKRRNTL